MRNVVATAPGQLSLAQSATPALAPGRVICQVAYLGMGGVDLRLSHAYSTYLTRGQKTYPFLLGHEWSGVIVEAAADVDQALVGRNVAGHSFITCGRCAACSSNRQENCENHSEMGILGGNPGAASNYVLVPASELPPIPAEISLRTAALIEAVLTALHARTRVGATATDRIGVLVTGTLGLAVALVARALGSSVIVPGVGNCGRDRALRLGADNAVEPAELERNAFDVVVEAPGSPDGVRRTADVVAPGGGIGLVGVPNIAVDDIAVADLAMKNARVEAVLSGIHRWDRIVRLVVTPPSISWHWSIGSIRSTSSGTRTKRWRNQSGPGRRSSWRYTCMRRSD